MPDTTTLEQLRVALRDFAAARDWDQFHTPKDLALSVAIELGELLEHFQWKNDGEIAALVRGPQGWRVEEELADVFIYLLRLADVLEVDVGDAVLRKIASNDRRYPANEVRGSSEKRS